MVVCEKGEEGAEQKVAQQQELNSAHRASASDDGYGQEDSSDELDTLLQQKRKKSPPATAMSLDQVLRWCLRGTSPIGRLDVLSKFGPLRDGKIIGGPHNCEHAMTEAEIGQMVWSEHRNDWKRLCPERENVDDILPLTLGVSAEGKSKSKSMYTFAELRKFLNTMVAEEEDPDKRPRISNFITDPLDFEKFQKVMRQHRRRRFRAAHVIVQHGGLLGPIEVAIKQVKEQAKLPEPKPLTITEKIDAEVKRRGGQVLMHLKSHHKRKSKAATLNTSTTISRRPMTMDTTVSTARLTDSWWGLRVKRTTVTKTVTIPG